jgi:hypothetical protein
MNSTTKITKDTKARRRRLFSPWDVGCPEHLGGLGVLGGSNLTDRHAVVSRGVHE